jgi:predicted Zn-dependent protease
VDRAIKLLRRGVAAEPDSPLVRFYLANALIEKGDEVAARAVAAEIRALDKTMKGHGLVRYYSNNPQTRDQFYRNLETLGLV